MVLCLLVLFYVSTYLNNKLKLYIQFITHNINYNYSYGDCRSRMEINYVSPLSCAISTWPFNESFNFILNTNMGWLSIGSFYTINIFIVILLVCKTDYTFVCLNYNRLLHSSAHFSGLYLNHQDGYLLLVNYQKQNKF